MKITAKQVAKAANVSTPAVSLAFRNYPGQAKKTREKILRIADELGYRPNLLVDSLRTGKTGMIGVLINLKDEGSNQILRGIEKELVKHDNVPIVLTPDGQASEKSQLNRLLDRRVDGIIMLPRNDAMFEEHLEDIIRRKIPLVVVDNPINEQTFHPCFVGTDDFEGGRIAANHLCELGHRKIGIMTTGTFPHPMHFRLEGFKSAVKTYENAFVFSMNTSADEKDKLSTALELLKLGPTAVFCTLDPLLPYIYQAADQLKLKIPEDLSVMGFAGYKLTHYLRPKATTLVQPFEKIGETAVEMLMSQINEQKLPDPKHIRYTPILEKAQSTKLPKSLSK